MLLLTAPRALLTFATRVVTFAPLTHLLRVLNLVCLVTLAVSVLRLLVQYLNELGIVIALAC